jgi:hypothetical protein
LEREVRQLREEVKKLKLDEKTCPGMGTMCRSLLRGIYGGSFHNDVADRGGASIMADDFCLETPLSEGEYNAP